MIYSNGCLVLMKVSFMDGVKGECETIKGFVYTVKK